MRGVLLTLQHTFMGQCIIKNMDSRAVLFTLYLAAGRNVRYFLLGQ